MNQNEDTYQEHSTPEGLDQQDQSAERDPDEAQYDCKNCGHPLGIDWGLCRNCTPQEVFDAERILSAAQLEANNLFENLYAKQYERLEKKKQAFIKRKTKAAFKQFQAVFVAHHPDTMKEEDGES